ncbi:hypothetical protein ACWCQM_34585 [Streptomyces sp. NPDC002125]
MRSPLFPPWPSSASPGALTSGEVVVVVVVVVVAGVFALAGLPVFGALEFIAGALCVALSSLRAMRTAAVSPPGAV